MTCLFATIFVVCYCNHHSSHRCSITCFSHVPYPCVCECSCLSVLSVTSVWLYNKPPPRPFPATLMTPQTHLCGYTMDAWLRVHLPRLQRGCKQCIGCLPPSSTGWFNCSTPLGPHSSPCASTQLTSSPTACFNSTHFPHLQRASTQLTFLIYSVLQLNSPSSPTACFNSTHFPHLQRASTQLTFLTYRVLHLNLLSSSTSCFNSTHLPHLQLASTQLYSTQLTLTCSVLQLNSTDLPLPLPASLLFSPSLKRCLLYLLLCLHCRYSVPLWSDVCSTFFAAYIAVIQSLSESMSAQLRWIHRRYSVHIWIDVCSTFFATHSPVLSLFAFPRSVLLAFPFLFWSFTHVIIFFILFLPRFYL
jgi:hypothetical protein